MKYASPEKDSHCTCSKCTVCVIVGKVGYSEWVAALVYSALGDVLPGYQRRLPYSIRSVQNNGRAAPSVSGRVSELPCVSCCTLTSLATGKPNLPSGLARAKAVQGTRARCLCLAWLTEPPSDQWRFAKKTCRTHLRADNRPGHMRLSDNVPRPWSGANWPSRQSDQLK